jgi:hypothetical protein
MHVSLREEKIVSGSSVNMRDTHPVTVDIHRTVKPGDVQFPLNLRERFRRNRLWNVAV